MTIENPIITAGIFGAFIGAGIVLSGIWIKWEIKEAKKATKRDIKKWARGNLKGNRIMDRIGITCLGSRFEGTLPGSAATVETDFMEWVQAYCPECKTSHMMGVK